MDGCEKCTINPAVSNTYFDCDLLDVYVYLCQAMPDMTQCVEWKEFCAVNPELEYCNSNAEGLMMPPPAMKMFFVKMRRRGGGGDGW